MRATRSESNKCQVRLGVGSIHLGKKEGEGGKEEKKAGRKESRKEGRQEKRKRGEKKGERGYPPVPYFSIRIKTEPCSRGRTVPQGKLTSTVVDFPTKGTPQDLFAFCSPAKS